MEQVTKKFMNWASILEDETRDQVQMTSEMPFVYPHIALMPDAHLGKGCAVGTVLPTKGAIIPAAVGVDIGCGMVAVRTELTKDDIAGKDLKDLRERIEKVIPLGPGQYNTEVYSHNTALRLHELDVKARADEINLDGYAPNWRMQLGTLGGGNHFIEVSLDEQDRLWLFLHSGSRGVGNKIAQHHIRVAQKQCEQRYIDLPSPDLAYLVQGDEEFWKYIRELSWAQRFAFLNREEMMGRVHDCLEEWLGDEDTARSVARLEEINCHHNYTEKERHFGEDVWLSRKGAIDAGDGVMGLIPGSMGDKSYVVRGLGNRLSLNSAPHGAGRVLGRRAAERAFTYKDLVQRMGDVEWSMSEKFLDEIPDAYKNIDVVMEDAQDLVEIEYTLRQIVNCKGE